MSLSRVHRYRDQEELSSLVAVRLLTRLVELQAGQDLVNLCLTGGGVAHALYEKFAELAPDSGLDAARLALWWGDERFVPTEDPDRHSQRALAILARTLPLVPSQIHAMPAADGRLDLDSAASQYAEEVGDTVFDLCLAGVGKDGHVAALFEGHKAPESTLVAVGIDDSPKPPTSRLTLTVPTLNRSRELWFLTTGRSKARAMAAALTEGSTLPAGRIRGVEATHWYLDAEAASEVPYHHCSL